MLEVSSLRVASGAMIRVDGLDLTLPERGCIALLGPNGAGKTTSVEAIAGLIPKAAGQVMFDGTDITRLSPSSVARSGLALVPQWRELFPNFSVEETLLAGGNAARGRPAVSAEVVYELFPGWWSGASNSPVRFPAASNRCWRSGEPDDQSKGDAAG